MPTTTRSVDKDLECTPETLFKGLAGCFGFLLTCIVVASLGIIAGGIFWTAQNMDRITSSDHYIQLQVVGAMSP